MSGTKKLAAIPIPAQLPNLASRNRLDPESAAATDCTRPAGLFDLSLTSCLCSKANGGTL